MQGANVFTWGELLAMLTLFSAIVGGIQWLISKAVVAPAIDRQFERMQTWAKREFPTSAEFEAHTKTDEAHQRTVERELERVWSQINK